MGRLPGRRATATALVAAIIALSGTSPATGLVSVRDVGHQLGLPRVASSWDVDTGDLDDDGDPDLVISFHSSVAFYLNTGAGLEPVFTVAGGDPHDCTIGDVDGNGLGDVYCTRGASHGTSVKANRLWMQTTPGSFEDQAASYGVEDPYGRGRRTTFLDIDGDPFPDLFVGNHHPRRNVFPSPNRAFLNVNGTSFSGGDLGLTSTSGARCVQAVDQNLDGWEDVLVCGDHRLFLYRNLQGQGFEDVAKQLGVGERGVRSALLEDLNGDGRLDLTTVMRTRLTVRPGRPGAIFGRPVLVRSLAAGQRVAIGNVDGRRGPDMYIVQGCVHGSNMEDMLLIDRTAAWSFRALSSPQARRGCGDVATAVDLNADGRDEFVVMNGRPTGYLGPVQVLTSRWG